MRCIFVIQPLQAIMSHAVGYMDNFSAGASVLHEKKEITAGKTYSPFGNFCRSG